MCSPRIADKFTGTDNTKSKGNISGGKIRKNGIDAGTCNVKLFIVSNARWSQHEAKVGDTVKLTADTEGYEPDTKAVFEIWERDYVGADDLLTKIESKVQGNKVETEWVYKYVEEEKEEWSEEEKKKGYSVPEYYFIVKVKNSQARSGLLDFKDWIEIELKDEDGKPVGGEEYILYLSNGTVKKGKLDQNGYKRVEDIPPRKCTVEFSNCPDIVEGK
ncbi:MAG: hypothetical protein ABH886_04085 [Candidatus Desantisbacteria bacterium]